MKLRRFLMLVLALALALAAVPAPAALAKAGYEKPYYIEIDLTNQIVTIFSTPTDLVVRQMICSTGLKDATPTGTFYLPHKEEALEREEWYYFRMYGCYAHYATRIWKGVLFHSIPCSRRSDSSVSKQAIAELGQPASHGCIRLRTPDAEFIAKCCLEGTRVKIYKSKKPDADLRDMLMQASYTNEKGQTYNEYLGIPDEEGVLGRFSKGSEVRDLQTRLRDLGIYADEIDSEYRGTTVIAVREAQHLMGEEETGVATIAFQQAIYSDDAPTAQNVTVQEGMSGPVVRNIQQYLTNLRLYDDAVDGVFDVDVRTAVEKFQGAYGYRIDGVLTPEIQKALYYESGKVQAMFSQDEGYECEQANGQIYMGQVVSNVGIRLRERASAGSAALERLTLGNLVVALEHGDTWSKVQRGQNVGYVRNDFLEYYQEEIYALSYTSLDGDNAYTIGYTPKEYYAGARVPAEVFADYLASGGSLNNYEGITTYATVNTDGPAVTLNLRTSPSTGSPVLAELSYGTQVKVLLRSSEWSLVEWQEQNGYLLNKYLEFWGAPDEEEEEAPIEEPSDDAMLVAVVRTNVGDKAEVYDVDSVDATVLGHLPNGIRVDVLETVDGWSHIDYEGHLGYMKDEDLQFLLGEEVST